MIEVQIKDKKLYDELKRYSNYNSDITQVCSFRRELKDMLESHDIGVGNIDVKRGKPILDIQGRKIMKLVDAQAEMLNFVGVTSEMDPTIPLRSMNEVNMLINNDLVDLSDKFKSVYSKLGYRSKINELISANVKFYGKGKLTDFIDGDLTIASLIKMSDIGQKKINYKQMDVRITEPLADMGRHREIRGKSGGEKVVIKLYSRSNILRSIAFEGNIISVATTKVLVRDAMYITDPIILPKGLTLIEDTMYSPPNRKIPVDLFRNALYEFLYRYEAKE